MDVGFLLLINKFFLVFLSKEVNKMNQNPISLHNFDLRFSINSITASKEANQTIFSKCTGQLSGQFLFNELNSRKTEEITNENENL